MTYLFYTLFLLACVVLIVSILLQPGKADAGALFTNAVSSTAFGPRGTATLLSKITIIAAAAFMIIGFVLSLPLFGTRSVLETQSAPPITATPAPSVSPQTSPATSTTPQNAASPSASTQAVAPDNGAATKGEQKAQPSPSKEQKK